MRNYRPGGFALERFGWIERSAGRLEPTEKGVSYFRFLAEQTRGIVEVYYATSNAVLAMQGSMSRKNLMKAADEHYVRSELLGEVTRRESANETAFRGSFDLMERRGILEPDPDSSGKEPAYQPGPLFDDVVSLRRRLAAALAAR